MRLSRILVLLIGAMCFAQGMAAADLVSVPQNLTEHSWMYFQGYMDDTKIYQTEPGFAGQKLVSGTRGSGTVSRTQSAAVYGGTLPGTTHQGYDDGTTFNEWGVFTNHNGAYTPPLTQSDLKNALCAKNYEVGSQISESYTNIRQLVKDTNIYQDKNVSVYQIGSVVSGTTRIGSRVQKTADAVPIYTMGGTYVGDLNVRMTIETGKASILTLQCP
jgi:hypothetical protein